MAVSATCVIMTAVQTRPKRSVAPAVPSSRCQEMPLHFQNKPFPERASCRRCLTDSYVAAIPHRIQRQRGAALSHVA